MVAYYDQLLLYLNKLIGEKKQSFNEMKTSYINLWTVNWSDISHVTACLHRAVCVVWRNSLFKTPVKLVLSFYFPTGLFSKTIGLWYVILTDWWMQSILGIDISTISTIEIHFSIHFLIRSLVILIGIIATEYKQHHLKNLTHAFRQTHDQIAFEL